MSISTESISYGQIANETLLNIFGAEMTYNDLKLYAKNINETTHLRVRTIYTDKGYQIVIVFFDDKEVMEKEYSINHSCDMFYHLTQLEQQCNECGWTYEQGSMCEHGTCPDCRHLCEVCKEEDSDDEEIFACKCGQPCSKNNLCGHHINSGVCCICEECLSELEEEDDEEEEIDYCRHCEEVLHYCIDHEKYCHKCCDCEDCKKACDEEEDCWMPIEELEYDDNGVLCKYTQEDGWMPIEDHCVECGFKPDECNCEK